MHYLDVRGTLPDRWYSPYVVAGGRVLRPSSEFVAEVRFEPGKCQFLQFMISQTIFSPPYWLVSQSSLLIFQFFLVISSIPPFAHVIHISLFQIISPSIRGHRVNFA